MNYLEQKISFQDNLESKRTSLLNELASCEKKREEYSGGIKEFYLDKVKGIITEEDIKSIGYCSRMSVTLSDHSKR